MNECPQSDSLNLLGLLYVISVRQDTYHESPPYQRPERIRGIRESSPGSLVMREVDREHFI